MAAAPGGTGGTHEARPTAPLQLVDELEQLMAEAGDNPSEEASRRVMESMRRVEAAWVQNIDRQSAAEQRIAAAKAAATPKSTVNSPSGQIASRRVDNPPASAHLHRGGCSHQEASAVLSVRAKHPAAYSSDYERFNRIQDEDSDSDQEPSCTDPTEKTHAAEMQGVLDALERRALKGLRETGDHAEWARLGGRVQHLRQAAGSRGICARRLQPSRWPRLPQPALPLYCPALAWMQWTDAGAPQTCMSPLMEHSCLCFRRRRRSLGSPADTGCKRGSYQQHCLDAFALSGSPVLRAAGRILATTLGSLEELLRRPLTASCPLGVLALSRLRHLHRVR